MSALRRGDLSKASYRDRSPMRVTTDSAFGLAIIVIHAVRAGTRMLSAAATTGLEAARVRHTGHDAIDPVATTAAVVDNHERDRFDMWIGDELVGVLGYLDECDTGASAPPDRRVVTFMHTVVAEEWTGNGLGALLVRAAFAHARNRNWAVRLVCPYAQDILAN